MVVTVRSRADSSEPCRCPSRSVRVSSRLRRVTSSSCRKCSADERLQAADVGQVRLEHFLGVVQQRPGGGETRLLILEAEADHRGDVEVAWRSVRADVGVEGPVRLGRECRRVIEGG